MSPRGRLLLTVLLFNAVIAPATLFGGAQAHDADEHFYRIPNRWPINATVGYKIDNSVSPLAEGVIRDAGRRWSQDANGRGPDFNFQGFQNMTGPFSPCAGENGVFRAHMGPDNGFQSGTVGYVFTCIPNGETRITGFTMIFNSDYDMFIGDPPPGEIDLWSIAVHEFGHASGWFGHLGDDSEYCDFNGAYHTMCPVYRFNRQVAWRTREEHDIHTVDNAYD